MITIAGDEDVSSFILFLTIGIDSVGETRSHIRNSKRESVLEVGRNSLATPIIIHRISRELVSPDSIGAIVSLVIVDEELSAAIAVEIDLSHIVGTEDQRVINSLSLNE